jgi:acyl-CoA synthetase (AMP-forming)/AMP-acid ligase II
MADTVLSALVNPLRECSTRTGIHLDAEYDKQLFVSYPDLYIRVSVATQNFRSMGIGRGSRVILPFATSFDCIVAFLALICVGAIPLSVRSPASGGNLKEYEQFLRVLVSRFGASFIIDVPGLDRVSLAVPSLSVHMDFLSADLAGWFVPHPEDVAFVQFSSGTTSEPKGVAIKHEQLIVQLAMIVMQDSRTKLDVGASWLPLYHDMGLVGALLTSIYAGHTLYLSSPSRFIMDPIGWLSDLSAHGVSITALPNFGMVYLLKKLREPEVDLQGIHLEQLRRIYLGSDTIDAATANQLSHELARHGLSGYAFTPCYGMAEAVLMVSCKPYDKMLCVSNRMHTAVVSVGLVLRGFELKLIRDDGAVAEPGGNGEIFLRGGSLGDCYFEDARPMLDVEGFYHTGDIGYVENGELYITGRIGERIKVNGQNYYLSHLENALQGHPGLRPGGVAIIQSSGTLTVLAEPSHFRSQEHLNILRSELSQLLLLKTGLKVLTESVIFVRRGQFKRTSSGKLQRNLITREFIDCKLKIYEVVPNM